MAAALVGLMVVGLKAAALVGLMVVGLKAAALVGLLPWGFKAAVLQAAGIKLHAFELLLGSGPVS